MNVGAVPERAAGWRLRTFESLGSTSDLCTTLAQAGEPDRLAVLALRQTAGRGRGGRPWVAPQGNLNLSVLLRPAGDAMEGGRYALLAGVALHDALCGDGFDAPGAPEPAPRLKWPNDVLLGDAKLAGILVESALTPAARLDWLVIGFGVNLAQAPALPDRPTASLTEAVGAAPPVTTLAHRVMAALDRWQFIRLTDGFERVRTEWLRRAHPLGTRLAVRRGAGVTVTNDGPEESDAAPHGAPPGSLGGRFAGLTESGNLLLQAGDTMHEITAGETILLPDR